jgi:hypothetical protein
MKALLSLVIAAGLSSSTFNVQLLEGRTIKVTSDLTTAMVAAHELQVNTFLGSGGQGLVRMFLEIPGVHGILNKGPLAHWSTDTETIRIQTLELIGIAASPQPRVYLMDDGFITGHLPMRELAVPTETLKREKRKVGVRPTDWFETAALAQLNSGNLFVSYQEADYIRGVGGIRASASCLACHEQAKAGDLLGAFTYLMTVEKEANQQERQRLRAMLDRKAADDELRTALNVSDFQWEDVEPTEKDSKVTSPTLVSILLAQNGFVTDELIKGIADQRAELEAIHLSKERLGQPPGWRDATSSAKPSAKQ